MAVAAQLTEILNQQVTPCISLYQPIYRTPSEQPQNPIRFENMVKQVGATLRDQHGRETADGITSQLNQLTEDRNFLRPNTDALAVFAAPAFTRVLRLPRPVREHVQVSQSFAVKPLIRILQAVDRFQVLGISASEVRVFEGNRDSMVELEPGDGVPRSRMEALPNEYTDPSMPPGIDPESRQGFGGPVIHVADRSRVDQLDTDIEQFFRVVDAAMTEHHSRPSGLPLILAALPQHHATFRTVTKNPLLLDGMIDGDPLHLSPEQLRAKAWPLFERRYLERLEEVNERFGTAKSKQLGDDDLECVAEAAAMSRVGTLLLDETKSQQGRLDPINGSISRDDHAPDDLFDELAELVLRRGGEVLVLPTEHMPTSSSAAAIYRF